MRATEHAPCDSFHVHERRHGLVEIVENGAVVIAGRLEVLRPAARSTVHVGRVSDVAMGVLGGGGRAQDGR